MKTTNFFISSAKSVKAPIVISCPHVGTEFPKDLKPQFRESITSHPPDTDWHVHKLYDFAPALGITLIRARFSRYVVDLNRPEGPEKLYSDERNETGIFPVETFHGEKIYRDHRLAIEDGHQRLKEYYWPYYREIDSVLTFLKKKFKNVLFFDAHSIKSVVKRIQRDRFPDLILSNNNGKSCHHELFEKAGQYLKNGTHPFEINNNSPFLGGQLTRHFGNPKQGIHAMQLEMCQSVYMDEKDDSCSEESLDRIRPTLKNMFSQMIDVIENMK